MKTTIKITKKEIMKNLILLSCFFFLSINSYSQVIADPALQSLSVKTVSNFPINPDLLPLGYVVELKVPILNLNLLNALPAGTCKIKIGLGSKLFLDPNFDLNNTNTSQYFNWTAVTQGGQVQLTGDLKSILPANFDSICEFRVKGSVVGTSTITTNFLITNHNTIINLSDENPSNNNAALAYTIIESQGGTTPVTFTGLAVKNEGCNIKVNFSTENELNVKQFEIEASKDGRIFTTMGQLASNSRINYAFSFPLNENNKASIIYVRIKSVDMDGRLQYTNTRTVKGICNEKLGVSLFPNPAIKNNTELTLRANTGIFNGKIAITLLDMDGKIINQKELNLLNADQFKLKTGLLASGQYLIKITGSEIESPIIARFQQL